MDRVIHYMFDIFTTQEVMLYFIRQLSCGFTYHLQHIAIPYMKVVLSVAGCCG